MTLVGFDLHTRYITACALDETGQILAERRQRSTALESVVAWLSALPGPLTVSMEATLYWEWLATKLRTLGHTVEVAHAFQVKRIWQARAKTDPIDARKLAPRPCLSGAGTHPAQEPHPWAPDGGESPGAWQLRSQFI